MARVTVEMVDHVARLAHLTLTPDERVSFTRHLAEILDYAEALQALDTSDVPPMSHAGTNADFRSDVPGQSLERDRVLDAAPNAADGLFRVPRVIGG